MLFRSGVQAFQASGYDVTPLYCDEPRMIPFEDAEAQNNPRYVIDCHLQANINIVIPQQYAQALSMGLIEVDAVYPPI